MKILVLLLGQIFSLQSFAGGITVENGGNIVRCIDQSYFQSLDYVLAKSKFQRDEPIAKVDSLNSSLNRIGEIIATHYPIWSTSYQKFIDQIGNPDTTGSYIWTPERNELPSVEEKNIHLPGLCRSMLGPAEISQAIIRTKNVATSQVSFRYDANLLQELGYDPLQLSFILIHEWLWNFYTNIESVRSIDYFLHSTKAESVTDIEFQLMVNPL